MTAVLHPRIAPRRSTTRATTWWGKAWVRAVEESSYAERDLVASRSLARGGHVGQISTAPGSYVASVEDRDGLWTVSGALPILEGSALAALVETVAAESGRIAALLAGDLPHTLVEHAEEAGVELLPYGAEFESVCNCETWADPCVHTLAVLQQLTWLIEADPFVLFQLRGLGRDDLLARLHARQGARPDSDPDLDTDLDTDLDVALAAALTAQTLLDELESSASGVAMDRPEADDPVRPALPGPSG